MDRVEEIILKFNKERKQTPEVKRMLWLVISLIIVILTIFIVMIIWNDYIQKYMIYGAVIIIVIGLILACLPSWYEGRLGTKKRKAKMIMLRRKRFVEEQNRLINLIKDNNMTPQQVYNILCKKYNRIPPSDTKVYIISISSIVLTLANIFTQPLNNMPLESYDQFIVMVILLLLLSGEFAYLVILFVSFFLNNNDEKFFAENNYIFKLLEDYVS